MPKRTKEEAKAVKRLLGAAAKLTPFTKEHAKAMRKPKLKTFRVRVLAEANLYCDAIVEAKDAEEAEELAFQQARDGSLNMQLSEGNPIEPYLGGNDDDIELYKKPKGKALEVETDFSVLLLYPDYIASNYGQETYLAHVQAKNPQEAIDKAQKDAMEANEDSCENASDFYCLLCIAGKHDAKDNGQGEGA